jgi:hypothetical protein
MMVNKVVINGAAASAPSMRVYNDSVTSPTDPSVTVVFSAASVDTDPASGEQVRMQISVKNSSV